ncbi:MAG TPA: dephospho-CoA kinase [Dokdonella sp.]
MTIRPFTVALTGGIASGKSAVADRFAALGANVVDADAVARALVVPGQPALDEFVAAFGADALDASGALDRRAMRERVFADAAARRTLEAILHPRVREALRRRTEAGTAPYAMLVVPLLVEGGGYDWVDRVLVVDAPRAVQRARLIARDGIAPGLADAMLDAQATAEQRLAIAHDVIDNAGPVAELDARVHALHREYLAAAGRRAGSAPATPGD